MKKNVALTRVFKGRSFVDVGGLWNTINEMVTTALDAGAARAVMLDSMSEQSPWWAKFDQHCADKGKYQYEKIVRDITAPNPRDEIGCFDVVHCSGVMYHVPDIFGFIKNLLSITNEYLFLGSQVFPSRIESPVGVIELSDDEALCTPCLTDRNLDILRSYFSIGNRKGEGISSDALFIDEIALCPKFGPWWWLYTKGFMCRIVGLFPIEIVEEGGSPNGRVYQILMKKKGVRPE
jgi:hypothetical protein